MNSYKAILGLVLLGGGALASAAPTVRLKDIASVRGLRGNQLVGIGLVTGLTGRGDSSSSPLLRSAVANLVSAFGFRITPEEVRSRNCAVVSVSAEVPAFLRPGERIDVKVASLGDARSLEGGILLQTPLKGANGRVYALAQGQVFTLGEGTGQKTVGSVLGGAIAEQEILSSFLAENTLALILKNPDFITAHAVAEALRRALPDLKVRSVDGSLVELEIPKERRADPVGFIAQLEAVQVTPDASNRVVIDSASGVIIYGEQVRIGKVAVSYKDLTLKVGVPLYEQYRYQLPSAQEKPEHFTMNENTTVEELVNTLRTIGVDTTAVIHLLKAIDKAGSLYGTLVIL